MVSPLAIQRLIALPFLVLGSWCLFMPRSVLELVLNPDYRELTTTTALLMGCFGSQAILSGLFAWFSRFTSTTFLAYGIALLPFFWFNYWFVYVEPVFNQWMALDFLSNAAMLGLSVWGWRISRAG
ncbi:MAG: hypothetical protein IPI83_05355 [Sphingomonadales bacterium]|nr:hypothetical protein [Sphingomonadales bacterium]MBL0000670.1 hypothetical protein [Sphingomonadales bacterium]